MHGYINAALESSIFEKDKFERKLEACIKRQRDHMHMEQIIIFPLLRKRLSAKQIEKLSTDYKSKSDTKISEGFCEKYNELYKRITHISDPNTNSIH